MRVAFITFEYPPRLSGGAGVYAENLVSNLAKLGHEIEVYVPDLRGNEVEHPLQRVTVHRVKISRDWMPSWASFCLRVTKHLEKVRGKEGVDVVHINSMGFFAFRDRARGPAYISTGHHLSGETASKANLRLADRVMDINGENGFLVPLLERYGVRFPDRYIAVSQETRASLHSLYQVDGSLVDVVWNGVDDRAAPAGPQDREGLRSELGIPPGPTIVFVGRVDDPRKDFQTVIRALALIPPGKRPTLLAIGSGHIAKPESLAKELGVLESISFRGRVSSEDLWKSYLLSDACVCASKQEGFGLTLLEALSAGCKVVSTEVGVAHEIRDKIHALVPVGSPNAMASAITDALEGSSKPLKVEVRVPYEFTWERSAAQTVAAYQKAIVSKADH